MENNSPIAVFDSGVGSYSIIRVLQKKLSNENIIYLADRANFPYGNKSREELLAIVNRTISWLENNYKPKLIVVASNTPSVQVLDEVRRDHSTNLIGIFPSIEHAVEISKTKHIAILGTKGMVESLEIERYINSKNIDNAIIHKVNASDLVALVESGTFKNDKPKTTTTVAVILEPILAGDSLIDVMTLSSTHLPFLREYFERACPQITFLDPAAEVATEVERALTDTDIVSSGPGSLRILATGGREADLKHILSVLDLDTNVEAATI
ncbi:hypothetical protein A3C21_01690 [Candidatus Kaiserbacteria bacterium RIFCSPHIGHO2_02_FULL_59_21]|uniref:Glutamate racemase n=2 Tax=Candidatus Kaiseribacteriota TaxID=1752734 RepID=A0A0G2BPK8_9BACT|nr:MAG: Glutamate racemase [Candidatus Kaiserbacteria bacterium GW2011_GWA2_58_9]OGG61626.1 MAG: hypothetical protein A2766_03010 [Candidatus Kaiserbacteria bacterium RIFCSPHIGHO2_01_FULL_58_22]OGG66843.1 MAG: hypothetical protein A3C21_01690 [Candidatus Kaiserbacteria bacterium RIFCSPHIGHO2_02_FULL_59_21]